VAFYKIGLRVSWRCWSLRAARLFFAVCLPTRWILNSGTNSQKINKPEKLALPSSDLVRRYSQLHFLPPYPPLSLLLSLLTLTSHLSLTLTLTHSLSLSPYLSLSFSLPLLLSIYLSPSLCHTTLLSLQTLSFSTFVLNIISSEWKINGSTLIKFHFCSRLLLNFTFQCLEAKISRGQRKAVFIIL
jgi:hypothetical protein